MSGKGKEKGGKPSVLDRIKKLMNATEPDEAEIVPEGEVDISKEGADHRPIMEEIFSDTSKKVRVDKTDPLEEPAQGAAGKKPVLHLHEVKLEEVKKEYHVQKAQDAPGQENKGQGQQPEQAAEEKVPPAGVQPQPETQQLPGQPETQPQEDTEKPAQAPRGQEKDGEKPKEEPGQPTAQEESPKEEKEQDLPAAQRQTPEGAPADPQEKPGRPHQRQKGQAAPEKGQPPVTPKAGQDEEGPAQNAPQDDGDLDREAAKSAALYDEKESLRTRLAGKLSAFFGFINAKPDEYVPDEAQAAVQPEPEQEEPVEILQTPAPAKEKKHVNKEPGQQAGAPKERQDEQVEELLSQARRDEKAAKEKLKTEEKQKKAETSRRYADFVKLSVQRLPEKEAEKMLVNGVRVPEYIHENDVKKIILPGDKIQHAIKREYEEYIKLEVFKETVAKKEATVQKPKDKAQPKEKTLEKPAQKAEEPKTDEPVQEEGEHKTLKDKLFGSYENAPDYSEFIPQKQEEVIEDYERPEDARAVRAEINMERRKLMFRSVMTGIAFVLSLVLVLLQRNIPGVLTDLVPNADIMYCIVNFLLLALGIALCHVTVLNGLRPLLTFRGNSDTAVAVAAVAAAAQGMISFFDVSAYYSGEKSLYTLLVLFALMLNSIGKLWIERRIRDNFKFISAPNRKYAVKILSDMQLAEKMVTGTKADRPIVAYQRRTKFLKNFLKLSYTPDPCETAAAKFAPVCTAVAVIVAIVFGIISKNASDAVSAFTAVACVGIPACCLLSVNLPMRSLCKSAVKNNAMVVGYPAVRQFADTRALMVDSRELYPRGRVNLLSVKTFNTYNIDKALVNAAAVMKVANTPMTYMFEDVIVDKGEELPPVESVKYEDGKGLICWVGGERLLIGTRELMGKYSIDLPSADFEESNKQDENNAVTYLANAGQLVAMLVTEYTADKRIVTELKRLEKSGVTVLIRTADPNVTQERVARDFRLYYRSIRILPASLGNRCKEEMSQKEESSRAYLSTRGKIASLARAVTGCIRIKSNISIAVFLQCFAVVIGILIVSTVVIAAGITTLGSLELFFFMLLWAVASIVAPMIQKP